MKKEKKKPEEVKKSLGLKRIEEMPEIEALESINSVVPEPLPQDVGVTVAAFMLNAENSSAADEFGIGKDKDQSVRSEILKAIQEEGEKF